MKRKKKRKYAGLWNERGFTLIEMLLSLAIFAVIVSLFPLAVRTFLDERFIDDGIRRMEWDVFSSQVRKEIRTAEELTVQPEKILMKIDGKLIIYERYGTNVRRRVDYQGHEILIQNISSIHFEKIPEGVGMSAREPNGQEIYIKFQKLIETGEVVP